MIAANLFAPVIMAILLGILDVHVYKCHVTTTRYPGVLLNITFSCMRMTSSPETENLKSLRLEDSRNNRSSRARLTLTIPSPPRGHSSKPVTVDSDPFLVRRLVTQGETEKRHESVEDSNRSRKPGRRLSEKMDESSSRIRTSGYSGRDKFEEELIARQEARKERIHQRVAELRKGFRSYDQIRSSERRRCVCCTVFWLLVISGLAYFGFTLRCHVTECCIDMHLHANLTGLKTVLRQSLFGQHLVLEPVVNTIRGHINNPSPTKPLVISFHGWTGNGKNFVTKFIIEHLFSCGAQSRFVRKFIASLDFAHELYSVRYKEEVRRQIIETVTRCERQTLFIFDEMDKMPDGVMDGVVPLLRHSTQNIDGIDLRRAIFVFISNLGGNEINDYVLKTYQSGRSRESLSTGEMERVISQLKNRDVWFQLLTEANAIDLLVPFLPMEKQHVKLCAKADMERKGYVYSSSDLERVADEMVYFPEDSQLFSLSGCKKVSSKTDLLMG